MHVCSKEGTKRPNPSAKATHPAGDGSCHFFVVAAVEHAQTRLRPPGCAAPPTTEAMNLAEDEEAYHNPSSQTSDEPRAAEGEGNIPSSPDPEDQAWRWGPASERYASANPTILNEPPEHTVTQPPFWGGLLLPSEKLEMIRRLKVPPMGEHGYTYVQLDDWNDERAGPQQQFHDLQELCESIWAKFGSLWNVQVGKITHFNPERDGGLDGKADGP